MGVVFLEHRRRAWQEKPRVHPGGLYEGLKGMEAVRVGSASLSGSLSVLIDPAFSKFRQGLISLLFFSERAF